MVAALAASDRAGRAEGGSRHVVRRSGTAGPESRNIVRHQALLSGQEPGPSVLALLTVSTGLAVLILAGVWFVFFRT